MFKYILSKKVVVENNAVLFSRNDIQFFSTLQKKNINNLVIDKIKSLKQSMDNAVVGHTNVKNGICLALIAKQHVYIEGPPGSAKTLLAETTANETNSKIFFTQLHRDTRINDLLGDEILIRETDEETGGEIIRQASTRGGILDCDIAVLDDITRAPGEALNVLFRVLNERRSNTNAITSSSSTKFSAIPLRTCIATGNPADTDKYYNESLDPASLDRFTIQLQHHGLIDRGMWAEAQKVINLYDQVVDLEDADDHNNNSTNLVNKEDSNDNNNNNEENNNFLQQCTEVHNSISVPCHVKNGLLKFLQILVTDYNLDHNNSILSDRTFLVNALKIIKANAMLDGRDICIMEDLYCLNLLTTFRVPMEVHDQVDDIIKQIIQQQEEEEQSDSNNDDGTPPTTFGHNNDDSNENKEMATNDADDNKKSFFDDDNNNNDDDQMQNNDSTMPQMNSSTNDEDYEGGSRSKGQSALWSRRDGKEDVDPYKKSDRNAFDPRIPNNKDNQNQQPQKKDINFDGRNETEEEDENRKKKLKAKETDNDANLTEHDNDYNSTTVKGIERLMEGISGKIQYCKHAQKERSVSGSPRQTKSSKSLMDVLDSHPSDRYLWINNLSPRLPRSFERITRKRSGSIVMIRDISGSMVGLPALWSSAVAQNVIKIARKNKMNMGYCEFNEKAYLYKKYDASMKKKNNNKDYVRQSYRNDETFDHEDGIFFTNDYQNVTQWAKQIRSEGTTNYSSPLKLVLDEFENQFNWYDHRPSNNNNMMYGSSNNSNNNSHIVLLTDGVPTEGDLKCKEEKRRAVELGVSIHTIFIDTVWAFDVRRMSSKNKSKQGSTYPVVLDELALLTQGLQYRASLDSNGTIDVLKHEAGTDRWSEVVSEARLRGMDRVGVMAGYGSQSPGYVTHPVVNKFK